VNQPVTVGNLVSFILGWALGSFAIVATRILIELFFDQRRPR
jgi:hypothetical protein